MSETKRVQLVAVTAADDLGYLGQQAVAEAMSGRGEYRIIGGHMARLLLAAFPTEAATPRSTLDADAAVGDVEVIGPLASDLLARQFIKERANKFVKNVDGGEIEINLLLPRAENPYDGLRTRSIPGLGAVDTLPELSWAMLREPLTLDLSVRLRDGQVIEFHTQIPDLEVAVVLKAHAWRARRTQKDSDLADLGTLLEIKHAHPEARWSLYEPELRSFRRDAARILHELSSSLTRKNPRYRVPAQLDRKRLAALIQTHVSRP